MGFRSAVRTRHVNSHCSFCVGTWIIDGEELALAIGIVSVLSSNPLSLAARALTGGAISKDELPTAFPTGVYGCARCGPLVGVLAGIREPSESALLRHRSPKFSNEGAQGG